MFGGPECVRVVLNSSSSVRVLGGPEVLRVVLNSSSSVSHFVGEVVASPYLPPIV